MSYTEKLFTLKGKVAVVTEGTGVLGSAMCYALANAGAKVVVLGRRMEAATAIASSIVSRAGEAMTICADVLDGVRNSANEGVYFDDFRVAPD